MREPLQDLSVFLRLVERLPYALEAGSVNGFEADEDPLASALRDQRDQFFVAQKVDADLPDPGNLRIPGDHLAQQRLGTLGIDGEVVVDKENRDLAPLPPFQRL